MAHLFGVADNQWGEAQIAAMMDHYQQRNMYVMAETSNVALWRNILEYPDEFGWNGWVWQEAAMGPVSIAI